MADGIAMSRANPGVETSPTVDPGTDYLLPKPPAKTSELVVEVRVPACLRHRESLVARSIGERALAVAECQQHLFAELREILADLDRSIGEATRVRLQSQVRSACSVLEWCEAVLGDQIHEAKLAASGHQPVPVMAVCEEVAGRWRGNAVDVEVSGVDGAWWGDAAALEDVVDAGLRLVRERAHGASSLTIQVARSRGGTALAIEAIGEPQEDVDPQIVEGFRDAVARIGGRTRPGRLGRGGTGLSVDLPEPGQEGADTAVR